jgi:predicted neuraminidase
LIAPCNPLSDRRPNDLEWCAFYLQEMVAERGVDVLLHSRVIDAVAVDGTIAELKVATAGEVKRLQPKFVIDASGRCIVPVQAGFPTVHEGANRQLPMSLYFTMWDTGQPVQPILPSGGPTWSDDDELPMTSLHRFDSGKVEVKMKVVGFDAADGASLSQAEMFARRQMMGLIYYLQTHGYAGVKLDRHVLASVSRQIGVREERRIVGEHTLSRDEVQHACFFTDAVAVGTYHLDYHWPDKMQRAGTGITTMVEPYHIPLRSLVPRGAKNLLVPGRGAAGDQMAMSSFRVMATVAQMGFAAGHAARLCTEMNSELSSIDIPRLQKAIVAGGQSLNLSHYGEYLRHLTNIHEYIFEEVRPFAQCHASTLVRLDHGGFLAAWFGGSHENNPDVGIWGSHRAGAQWSPPRLLAKINGEAHWNPVLLREPEAGAEPGRIHLWFKVGPTIVGWQTWHQYSDDSGQTWSAAEPWLHDESKLPRGPVKNKPIVLSDGSWLVGFSDEPNGADGPVWDAWAERSTDGGRTWSEPVQIERDIAAVAGAGVIQPTLWETAPGHVHMLLRSTCGRVCRSDSIDFGATWSPVYLTDLPHNNSGLDAVLLQDGALALVCNPVAGRERTPLSVLLSHDNGISWSHRLDLETEPGEYSYPAIIATAVGMAITYTRHRERIVFRHFSVEQIPQIPVRE